MLWPCGHLFLSCRVPAARPSITLVMHSCGEAIDCCPDVSLYDRLDRAVSGATHYQDPPPPPSPLLLICAMRNASISAS